MTNRKKIGTAIDSTTDQAMALTQIAINSAIVLLIAFASFGGGLAMRDTEEVVVEMPVYRTIYIEAECETCAAAAPAIVESPAVDKKCLEFEAYDVPLDEELQRYIVDTCELYGIDPAIVIAMIGRESSYRAGVVGDSGKSYGLMQIQSKWHKERMERLGCSDLLNPEQNVLVGVDFLAELHDMGKGMEWALMSYNGGMGYANRLVADGIVSSYAREVLAEAEALKGVK